MSAARSVTSATVAAFVLASAVSIGLVLPGRVAHAAPRSSCGSPSEAGAGTVCEVDQGWEWVYDATLRAYRKVLKSTSTTAGGATYVYTFAPACGAGVPDSGELCGRALLACGDTDPGAIYYDVWKEETAPVPGDRVPAGSVCLGGPADAVTVAQLGRDVQEVVRDHLPELMGRVQPNPTAIVNLPIVVSAPVAAAPDFAIEDPVPGAIVVTATYSWLFDDGATLVGPGRAFDGTDPASAPEGYYLTHTYTRADAQASATLTIDWHAVFTVDGGPPVALPDIVAAPQTVRFQVHEVQAVLVTG